MKACGVYALSVATGVSCSLDVWKKEADKLFEKFRGDPQREVRTTIALDNLEVHKACLRKETKHDEWTHVDRSKTDFDLSKENSVLVARTVFDVLVDGNFKTKRHLLAIFRGKSGSTYLVDQRPYDGRPQSTLIGVVKIPNNSAAKAMKILEDIFKRNHNVEKNRIELFELRPVVQVPVPLTKLAYYNSARPLSNKTPFLEISINKSF